MLIELLKIYVDTYNKLENEISIPNIKDYYIDKEIDFNKFNVYVEFDFKKFEPDDNLERQVLQFYIPSMVSNTG